MTPYSGTLLPEHLDLAHTEREKWVRIGLSTDRCDRPTAEAAVRRAYQAAGLDPPPLMIWMDSPLGGVVAGAVLRGLTGKSVQLRGQLWDQLRGQLWDQLWGQLGGQLWDQLRDQLGGQLGGQLWDQLRDQLRGQLSYDVSAWRDSYWLALYTCALPTAQLPPSDRLTTVTQVCANTGWWWAYRGVAILTDRPTTISRDGQGRLHHETGPALTYADGYTMHSWHGVRVPADLIETGWNPQRILTEPNAEIRRCAVERIGWDKFIADADLTRVDTADDPGNPGQQIHLYDVSVQLYEEPVRVLLCTNGTVERDGTLRRFGLTVPPDMPDAVTAAGWTYGLTGTDYAAAQRRT